MPLSPIPTRPTLSTVPGAGILDDLFKAERVPVSLAALFATIKFHKLLQGDLLTTAGQIKHCLEISPGESFVFFNVVNRAGGYPCDIDAVEGIATGRTMTIAVARLAFPEAGTAFGATSGLAAAGHRSPSAVYLFI